MNVFDKDYLFEMSYAFMRRFTFLYLDLPEDSEISKILYIMFGEKMFQIII